MELNPRRRTTARDDYYYHPFIFSSTTPSKRYYIHHSRSALHTSRSLPLSAIFPRELAACIIFCTPASRTRTQLPRPSHTHRFHFKQRHLAPLPTVRNTFAHRPEAVGSGTTFCVRACSSEMLRMWMASGGCGRSPCSHV